MSQLLLSCHIGARHPTIKPPPSAPFIFRRIEIGPATRPEPTCYRVEEITEIHAGSYATVYRASLKGHPTSEALDVVLKTDVDARYPRSQEYRKEATNYEVTLAELQDQILPVCYGLFQATLYDKLVSILVLEYCGKPLPYDSPDSDMDDDFRTDVFDAFQCLHCYGYQHNDVAPRNFLHREEDDRVFIIDLEHIEPHDCGMALRIIMGDFKPPIDDFGCNELYYLAASLHLWEPSYVDFYGYNIPVEEFKPGRAQNVIEALPEFMRESEKDKAVLLREAEKSIREVEAIRAEIQVSDEARIYKKPPPPSQRRAV